MTGSAWCAGSCILLASAASSGEGGPGGEGMPGSAPRDWSADFPKVPKTFIFKWFQRLRGPPRPSKNRPKNEAKRDPKMVPKWTQNEAKKGPKMAKNALKIN